MRKHYEKLKQVYKRAEKELPKHTMDTPFESSVLYRGYKIQYLKDIDLYLLFQTRTSNYYKYVPIEQIDEFVRDGLRNVADRHQIDRDEGRLEALEKKIAASDKNLDTSMVKFWKKQRTLIFIRLVQVESSLKRS